MKNDIRAWGVALVACTPLLATAQDAKTEQPKAPAQLTYRSAFADYKPYKEAPLANWRELNDAVAGALGEASGHAGHGMGGMKGMEGMKGMKGMEMPAASAAPASGAMPMKPMPMHDSHPEKGGKP